MVDAPVFNSKLSDLKINFERMGGGWVPNLSLTMATHIVINKMRGRALDGNVVFVCKD